MKASSVRVPKSIDYKIKLNSLNDFGPCDNINEMYLDI